MAVMPYNYGSSQEDDYDPFARQYGGNGSGIGNGDGGNAAPVQDSSSALTGMMGYGNGTPDIPSGFNIFSDWTGSDAFGAMNPVAPPANLGQDAITPPAVTPSIYQAAPAPTPVSSDYSNTYIDKSGVTGGNVGADGTTGPQEIPAPQPSDPIAPPPPPAPAPPPPAPVEPPPPAPPPPSSDPVSPPPQEPPPVAPPVPAAPPPVTVPSAQSAADILPTLITGASAASGGAAQPLQSATQAATLAELQNPSPYTSQNVKDLYTTLAGNIDTSYDANARAINDRFARAGLYDSAGKDFASGRLADNAVQARTAKEALANDLAQNYAQTAGQYQANAINQGQSGTQQANSNQLNWLNALMGYGQQGFQNDVTTAGLNLRQNEDQQALEEAMLAAGYTP